MENTINLWPIVILLLVWTLFLELGVHPIIKNIKSYFNPPDEFKWAKKYLGHKIKFERPGYKGQEGQGTISAILNTKDKGKGGVPKYKLLVDEGSAGSTPIFMDSKWEYLDAKNRP